MTTFDRIEPRLPELIDELATARVPDYFDDLLQSTAHARQRPAWSSPERWLPMGVLARPLPHGRVPWRPVAVVLLAAIVMAAGLLITAGSRPRLPDPFGPAANGTMFYHDAAGVIHAADPVTGTSTAIVIGPDAYEYPLPSRDGQHIVFAHTSAGTSQLFVAEANGGDAHPLAGTYEGHTWTEWSPDGAEIAVVSMIDGRSTVSLVKADGSGTAALPLDREVKIAWYLPDGRLALIAGEAPSDRCRDQGAVSTCALMVVARDGIRPDVVLSSSAFAGLSLHPSPDGRRLLYVRWAEGDTGSLHVVDVETGQDRVVRFDNRDPAGDESNLAEFSPDGSLILFDRYHGTEEHFAVVSTDGGVVRNVGPAWDRPPGTMPEAHFSPDGRSVIAYYPRADGPAELWLLDATGQGQDRRLDLPVTYAPAWQRLAP